ncbi:MAG: response regulator [Treponema sp.]|nr:response regulator [Treponema sp.]
MTQPDLAAKPGKKRKIIYIDDVNYNLITFNKGLGKKYDIYLGESASQMYRILEKVTPDVIILDVNMPNINGYEIIKELKNDDRYLHIPVIFLTSNIERKDIAKGLNLGAADYVLKPINTEKIIKSIENQFNTEKIKEKKTADKKNINVEGERNSILIIDDIPSMLRTIHHALHNVYDVYLLSNPEVVVDFLSNNKPDLIILDYLMPKVSGFDLIPIIKGIEGYETTPIIIITTEGTIENVRDAMLLGASDFIAKPFGEEELNFKVEKHLRLSKELKEKND